MNPAANNSALALANSWQRSFPLHPHPFAIIGADLNLAENKVIELMQSLTDQRILSRIGVTVRPNTAGASTLAAMAVPNDRLHEIALMVNDHPSVNHNYERAHEINLWFVVAASNRDEVTQTLNAIAKQSGIEVLDLPLVQAYHIDLGFPLDGKRRRHKDVRTVDALCVGDADVRLLTALQEGLELVSQPYSKLAADIDCSEKEVLTRLEGLIDRGIVSRFGCILRHRQLGYVANAMSVWDVPDGCVDAAASKLAARGEVTLCYQRKRRSPRWPYNLFAMIHGQEREAVMKQIARAECEAGLNTCPSAILFSRRCFKQRGARLDPPIKGAA